MIMNTIGGDLIHLDREGGGSVFSWESATLAVLRSAVRSRLAPPNSIKVQ